MELLIFPVTFYWGKLMWRSDCYQIGIPSDREQYIHRLGRTGREGKEGEGILLLAPWEEYFLDEIRDLPLEKIPLPHLDPNIKLQVSNQLKAW